jgi:hypothetical protein
MILRRFLSIAAIITLAACGPNTHTAHVCTCEQMARVQAFVTANTAASNNHSDEEMEDVIDALFRTGVKTTCPERMVNYLDNNFYSPILDSCETAYIL